MKRTKELRTNKGITLIALVITIIIMLILVGVTISMAVNGGLFEKAGEAVAQTKEEMEKEKELKETVALISYYEYQAKKTELPEGMTAHQYVKQELANKGYDVSDIIVYDDGRIIVGATKIAVDIFEAGVPIGTEVTGYDISNNATSYTTDGKELTYNGTTSNSDGIPQTVNVATDVSWTYMGTSDDGEALIVLDLDNASVADADASAVYSTMALGGPGGYLNGVNALNTVCDALYSTEKGNARSINYEDILTGLKYNGPKSQYTDESGATIRLNEIKTIGELTVGDNSLVPSVNSKTTLTPDGSDIESYKADYLWPKIRKVVDGEFVMDEDAKYVKADTASVNVIMSAEDINYWIADTCTSVDFKANKAYYQVRRGGMKNISAYAMATSFATDGKTTLENRVAGNTGKVVLRPVVELADELTFSYADNTLTLN